MEFIRLCLYDSVYIDNHRSYIYIAPSCKNELQIVARVLLVMSIVGAFAVIRKNIKRNCNKQIK